MTTILSTIAAPVGVLTTALVSTRDLRLRRQTETTKGFLDLIAHANGRPRDGRQAVGVAEQLAAIRMIGSLGKMKVRAVATSNLQVLPRRMLRRARL